MRQSVDGIELAEELPRPENSHLCVCFRCHFTDLRGCSLLSLDEGLLLETGIELLLSLILSLVLKDFTSVYVNSVFLHLDKGV